MASLKVIECSNILAEREWTITFIETASGGKMSYEFSTVPNSENVLIGGMVCYNTHMKEDILEIPHDLLDSYEAESAEVAKAMANNFCKSVEADVCVAMTGITTASDIKTTAIPVGIIFLHIILPHKQIAKRFEFSGSKEEIINQAIDSTATEVIKEIQLLNVKSGT